MRKPFSERSIAWALALLSVAIVWQTDITNQLTLFATHLGTVPGSFLHQVITNVGIATVFVGCTWLAVQVYERVIWRWWPLLGCKQGWWLYALVANREQGRVSVAGLFFLRHTSYDCSMTQGRAFYYQNGPLSPRGDWVSEVVCIKPQTIHALFEINTVAPIEPAPPRFQGFASIEYTEQQPVVGIECWDGHYYDHEQHGVKGWIYCERLSPFRVTKLNQAKDILQANAASLMARVSSRATDNSHMDFNRLTTRTGT